MHFNLLTQFGSSSGLGTLGLNASSFLIQLLTFIIALLVLKRWAFKPILKVMNERRETIEKGVQLGEKMQKEKAEMEARVEKTLHDSRAKADDIIAAAQETARQSIREAETKAKEKADQIVESAQARIIQETNQARQKLETELISLVAEATEAVTMEKVDAKKDAQLIEKSLREASV